MMRPVTLLAPLLLLAVPATARAHADGLECALRGAHLEVAAFFDDDTPARGAKVSVFDAADKLVASARTGADGKCRLPRPAPGSYRVDLNAGAGHFARRTIEVPPRDPSGPADPPPGPLDTGPPRAAFTAFPWGRVLIGLAVIAVFAVLAWLASRGKNRATR
jgi:hypothetical protein